MLYEAFIKGGRSRMMLAGGWGCTRQQTKRHAKAGKQLTGLDEMAVLQHMRPS